jgi:hypothetical protein
MALRREGGYLLRSNSDPGYLWRLYLQLVEVEQAFKELKNDLSIRPVYHQLETRIEADQTPGRPCSGAWRRRAS